MYRKTWKCVDKKNIQQYIKLFSEGGKKEMNQDLKVWSIYNTMESVCATI